MTAATPIENSVAPVDNPASPRIHRMATAFIEAAAAISASPAPSTLTFGFTKP